MARTLAGNLTGKAAQMEAADLRERIEHDAWMREKSKHLTSAQFMDVCGELLEIMGEVEYQAWCDITPAKGFADYAATKLVALKSLAPDPAPLTPAAEYQPRKLCRPLRDRNPTAQEIALDENGNLRPYSSFPRTSGAIADDHEIHSYTVDGE